MKIHPEDFILMLDFGGQYTQLITRKVRELNVYSEIKPYNVSLASIKHLKPKGIILSGGPESVYADKAPLPDAGIFRLGIPILGICYGLQLVAYLHGGKVTAAGRREYGLAELSIDNARNLFKDVKLNSQVWMSHGDAVTELPAGFEILAHTGNSPCASFANPNARVYCVQFHPEVKIG